MWSESSCAFPKNGTATEVGESARAMASTARQKRWYLHHQGEFQHKNCTLGSLNDSDHDGVGRFFVGHSQGSVRLINYLHYLRGATALLVAVATPRLPRRSEANYCSSFQLTHMPRGSVDRERSSNGDQEEDKTALTT